MAVALALENESCAWSASSTGAGLSHAFDAARDPTASLDALLLERRLNARLIDATDLGATRLGRFELSERIGSGGMGAVYLARDPVLHRRVAIKVLRHSGSDPETLRREAQCLAQLTHPNVVRVFDVGTGRVPTDRTPVVFIVMELIDGQPLSVWLRQERAWRDVLEACISAGEGLAAAHARGIVHGDFKPSNVLRSSFEEIKVIDFGLARLVEGQATPSHARIGGTLGYCAPEKLLGQRDSIAADIFSFSAMTYEAIHGRRPFPATTREGFLAQVRDGVTLTASRRNPRLLERILARGLALDPAQRWSSIEDVILALRAVLEGYPRRRVWVPMAFGGLAVLTGVSALQPGLDDVEVDVDCSTVALNSTLSWESKRGQLDRRLRDDDTISPEQGERILRALDTYVGALGEAHQRVCEVGNSPEESAAVALGIRHCLDDLGWNFDQFVADSTAGDTPTDLIVHAALLPQIDECSELSRKEALAWAQRDHRDAEIMRKFRQLNMHRDVRVDAEHRGQLTSWLRRAEASNDPLVRITGFLALGRVHDYGDDFAVAQDLYQAAYFSALREGFDALALRAALCLAQSYATYLGRPDSARKWLRHAEAILIRQDRPLARAWSAEVRSYASIADGEHVEARRHIRDAVALYKQALGHAHPVTLDSRTTDVLLGGRVEPIETLIPTIRRLIDDHVEVYGAEHLTLARLHIGLGLALSRGRDPDAGSIELQRAIALIEQHLGPESFELIAALSNWAHIESNRGNHEQVIAIVDRTLALTRKFLEEDDVFEFTPLTLRGFAELNLLEPAQALRSFQRALDIGEKSHGDRSYLLLFSLSGVACASWALDDTTSTVRYAERVLAIEVPPTSNFGLRERARVLWVLAQAQRQLGLDPDWRTTAKEALEACRTSELDEAAALVEHWIDSDEALDVGPAGWLLPG